VVVPSGCGPSPGRVVPILFGEHGADPDQRSATTYSTGVSMAAAEEAGSELVAPDVATQPGDSATPVLADPESARYDFETMYAALETQRRSRRLSRRALAQTIHVSETTLKRLARGEPIEAHSVFAIVWWLDQPISTFTPGAAQSTLPAPGTRHSARFDSVALFTALDAQRRSRRMSWPQVSAELSPTLNPARLRRLADGGRMTIDEVLGCAAWLRSPPEAFTTSSSA
jgi:hypothetical protein